MYSFPKYAAVALTVLSIYSCGKKQIDQKDIKAKLSKPVYSIDTLAKKEDIFKDIDLFNLSDSLSNILLDSLKRKR